MTSAINTSGIDVNYPVPGVNNSSQGFRDNFAAIKTNLQTSANEITDLQNKAIFKSALTGTTLDNNMANTLISNAAVRGFRASTYNLGNDLSGTVVVNVSLGDVQYGSITGDTTLQFTGWAPSGTQSNVQLQLAIANSLATISLPMEVKFDGASGLDTIENVVNIGGIGVISIPNNVTEVDYRFSTLDCGTNINIEPFNRPRQSTQVQLRSPTPIGFQGDVPGTFCMDQSTAVAFATCTSTDGSYYTVSCDSTTGFYLDMPVVFTGVTFGGILAGATYYIRTIPSSTTFTLSTVPGTVSGPGQIVALSSGSGQMYLQPVSYLYASTGDYDGTTTLKYVTDTTGVTTTVLGTNTSSGGNLIAVTSTSSFVSGYPVAFSGTSSNGYVTATNTSGNITVTSTTNMVVGGRIYVSSNAFGGLSDGGYYYIQNVDSLNSNIKLTADYYNAVQNTNSLIFTTTTGNSQIFWNNILGNIPFGDYYVKDIEPNVTSGQFIKGRQYKIVSAGTTDFMSLGSVNNLTNTIFTATGTGLVTAGSFVVGQSYTISYVGTTNWVSIGAASSTLGVTFTATGAGSGTGQATQGTGTAKALNQFSISSTVGGSATPLISENGSMQVTTITDYTLTLTSTAGLSNNMPVIFAGSTFGGVFDSTIYYIANVKSGTDISLSSTVYNGVTGQKLPVTTATGNMAMYAYSGTSIWKSVPLKPLGSTDDGSVNSGDLTVLGNLSVNGKTTVGNISANIANANTFNGNFVGNLSAVNITVSSVANFTSTTQIKIAGGSSGYYLQTDGAGNVSWAAGTISGTTTAAGGSNTQVQFNDSGTIAGNANLTFNKTSGLLTVGNALSVTGNVVSGNASVTGNITAGNITSGNIVLSGNITANNFTTSTGKVTTPLVENGTSNVKIVNNGNIAVSVAGNANIIVTTGTGANITGTLSVSGNANVGNIGATNGVFLGSLSGVTSLTASANISTATNIIANLHFTGTTIGISAAGTTQGTATQLSTGYNVVNTVTGTAQGVVLPASATGMRIMVRNNSANTLYVYPYSGSTINFLATNAAYQQNANSTNEFFCVSSTQWYSLI